MKILLFGKNGQVGSQLNQLLTSHNQVIALDIEDLDLTDGEAIKVCINSARPDWVLNASAYTAVDEAEVENELAGAINTLAPAIIAKTCATIGARMLHYSTDYVFDGCTKRPYVESDPPNPQNVYGQTKLAGEDAVLHHLPQAVILRTAWVYARHGSNFVNTMRSLATQMTQIRVVNDQYGSPTLADDLASVSIQIIDKINTDNVAEAGGIYHATGAGQTNWFELAKAIFTLSGNKDIKVVPISSTDYPTPAARPMYSILSNEKLKSKFDLELPHWQDALARCLG